MGLIDYFRILKTIIILFSLYICTNNVSNQNVKVQEETLVDSSSDAVKTTLRLYAISRRHSLFLKFFNNFYPFLCHFVTCIREYYGWLCRLKVVSTTFLLVCFVILKDSTCETRKNVFLFHFKSSFRSWDNQILTFQIFKYYDVIKCPSMKHQTHFTE